MPSLWNICVSEVLPTAASPTRHDRIIIAIIKIDGTTLGAELTA